MMCTYIHTYASAARVTAATAAATVFLAYSSPSNNTKGFARAAMGSVGENFACPWCGRTGNGGYAPDVLGYPICTGFHTEQGESYGCLWRHLLAPGGAESKHDYDRRALEEILRAWPRQELLPILLAALPPFLS